MTTITWTNASGITWIPLIGKLSQSTPALALFKLYRLARCCFRVDFKMSTSQYMQGAAFVGWLPNINTAMVPADVQSLSAYHSLVLSASKQESCSFTIPFCSPENFFDTTLFSPSTAEHASVFFYPFMTLLSTNPGLTASIPIDVWANIEECDLSGVQSQSRTKKDSDKEAAKKSTDGKDQAVGSVIRNTSQLVRRIPVVGAVWGPIADVINTIFGTELSNPVTKAAPKNVLQMYAEDCNQVDGLVQAQQLSLYLNPRMKVAPLMFGMDTTYKSLRAFAAKPMLYDLYTFDGGAHVLWTSVVRFAQASSLPLTDYLYTAATLTRFVRGSIKYLFYFNVPVFYSCRLRVFIRYNTTISDIANVHNIQVDVKGEVWLPIIAPDLNFRTWHDQGNPSNDIFATIAVQQLSPIVGVPSPSTAVLYMAVFRAGGEDTQFAVPWDPVELFTAEEKYADLNNVRSETSINKMFESGFEPIAEGQALIEEEHAVMSETVKNVIDLLKRPATYSLLTAGQINYMGQETYTFGHHTILAASHMFQRGSSVIRHLKPTATGLGIDGFYLPVNNTFPPTRPNYGWVPAYTPAQSFFQTEAVSLPWYCACPYMATVQSTPYILATSLKALQMPCLITVGYVALLTQAAGDDFAMMFQVPWANQIVLAGRKHAKQNKKLTNGLKLPLVNTIHKTS
jgi:hypothetical protein